MSMTIPATLAATIPTNAASVLTEIARTYGDTTITQFGSSWEVKAGDWQGYGPTVHAAAWDLLAGEQAFLYL